MRIAHRLYTVRIWRPVSIPVPVRNTSWALDTQLSESQPLHSQIWDLVKFSKKFSILTGSNSHIWEMVRGSTRSELGKSSQTLHSQIWVVRPDKFSQAPILTSEKSSQTLHSQIWVCLSFSSQIWLCSLSHISLWTLSLWSGVQQRCTLSAEISREKTHTEKWTRPAKSSPRQSDDLSSWQDKSSSRKAESQ